MMPGMGEPAPASRNSTNPNGSFRTSRKSRSLTAARDDSRDLSCAPMAVLSAQRFTEATTSRAVTGDPSWNFRLERSV